MKKEVKKKKLIVKSLRVIRKTNGYLLDATIDGGAEWHRELVFTTKQSLLKWLGEHLPAVEVWYEENRKYYDLKEVKGEL